MARGGRVWLSLEGTEVRNHLRRFEAWAISFTPLSLCPCLSEETVKAVGPFYLVSMPGEVKDPMQGNETTLVCFKINVLSSVLLVLLDSNIIIYSLDTKTKSTT